MPLVQVRRNSKQIHGILSEVRTEDRLERKMSRDEIIEYLAGYSRSLENWAWGWSEKEKTVARITIVNLMASFDSLFEEKEKYERDRKENNAEDY